LTANSPVLVHKGEDWVVAFVIDGAYWYVIGEGGEPRTWPCKDRAKMWLMATARSYRQRYGEDIGWDLDHIPVIEERG
jgi:hypothetical protein